MIKLLEIGKLDEEGNRTVTFEVNDSTRAIKIYDKTSGETKKEMNFKQIADPNNPLEIGSSIPGKLIKVLVKEGEQVKENQIVAIVEAMKMETNIKAPVAGVVESVIAKEEQQVESGELLIKLSE